MVHYKRFIFRILRKLNFFNRGNLGVAYNGRKYVFPKFQGLNWDLVAMASMGIYESSTLKIIKQYIDTDKVSIDIGANVGIFSLFLDSLYPEDAKLNNRIISIEPLKQNFEYLKKLSAFNDINKIEIFNLALSNRLEEASFFVESNNPSAWGSLYRPLEPKSLVEQKVNQVTLDFLMEESNDSIGFIKIDVEGYELEVLEGAILTIKKNNPIICFELNSTILSKRGRSIDGFINFFNECEYKLFFENSRGSLQPFACMEEEIMNIHAFPK